MLMTEKTVMRARIGTLNVYKVEEMSMREFISSTMWAWAKRLRRGLLGRPLRRRKDYRRLGTILLAVANM